MAGPRRFIVLVVALAALVPVLPASASAPCDRPFEMPMVGTVCERESGLFEVFSDSGQSLGFTHGLDAPPDPSTAAAPPPFAPVCVASGSAYSMRVIYARPSNRPDRYAAMAPLIRDMVKQANGYLAASAAKYGVGVDYRVQCSGTTIIVDNRQLASASSPDFDSIVSQLNSAGYTNGQMKYWVWYDNGASNGCGGGVGHVYEDDQPGVANLNNGNGIALFAVTFNCQGLSGAEVMMHENGHNMGAVQNSAPRSTLGLHCIDGRDIMCYNDDGARGDLYTETSCSTTVFDCNNNDYFHPSPTSGSYLATHWNLAANANRFISRGGCALAATGILQAGSPGGVNGGGVFGVNVERVPIPSGCVGRPFFLVGTSGGQTGSSPEETEVVAGTTVKVPNFDVCFENEAGTRFGCFTTLADEAGTVPSGTTRAGVFLTAGTFARWTLSAS